MSSRFNELYRGEPGDVADQLEETEASEQELRAGLINALRRIKALESWVAELRDDNARARNAIQPCPKCGKTEGHTTLCRYGLQDRP
jgi:hypothetical protein